MMHEMQREDVIKLTYATTVRRKSSTKFIWLATTPSHRLLLSSNYLILESFFPPFLNSLFRM